MADTHREQQDLFNRFVNQLSQISGPEELFTTLKSRLKRLSQTHCTLIVNELASQMLNAPARNLLNYLRLCVIMLHENDPDFGQYKIELGNILPSRWDAIYTKALKVEDLSTYCDRIAELLSHHVNPSIGSALTAIMAPYKQIQNDQKAQLNTLQIQYNELLHNINTLNDENRFLRNNESTMENQRQRIVYLEGEISRLQHDISQRGPIQSNNNSTNLVGMKRQRRDDYTDAYMNMNNTIDNNTNNNNNNNANMSNDNNNNNNDDISLSLYGKTYTIQGDQSTTNNNNNTTISTCSNTQHLLWRLPIRNMTPGHIYTNAPDLSSTYIHSYDPEAVEYASMYEKQCPECGMQFKMSGQQDVSQPHHNTSNNKQYKTALILFNEHREKEAKFKIMQTKRQSSMQRVKRSDSRAWYVDIDTWVNSDSIITTTDSEQHKMDTYIQTNCDDGNNNVSNYDNQYNNNNNSTMFNINTNNKNSILLSGGSTDNPDNYPSFSTDRQIVLYPESYHDYLPLELRRKVQDPSYLDGEQYDDYDDDDDDDDNTNSSSSTKIRDTACVLCAGAFMRRYSDVTSLWVYPNCLPFTVDNASMCLQLLGVSGSDINVALGLCSSNPDLGHLIHFTCLQTIFTGGK